MAIIDQPWLGGLLMTVVWAAVQYFNLKIENDFRAEFKKDLVGYQLLVPQAVISAVLLVAFVYFTRQRYVAMTWPAFAGAAATLTGVWRVDRDMLLIPDRNQLIGAGAAAVFLVIQLWSGESPRELFTNVGLGLSLVLLLWALSAIYYRIRGQIGFGLGDVKLLAWMSVFAGQRTIDIIMLSIGIGLIQIVLSSFLGEKAKVLRCQN